MVLVTLAMTSPSEPKETVPRETRSNTDSRLRQRIIREDAGDEHIGSRGWRYVEAPQDSLFTKRDQSGAQTPEAAHHVQAENWSEKISNGVGVALGENAGVQKEESQRHHQAEKEKHFVAQRELHAHAR